MWFGAAHWDILVQSGAWWGCSRAAAIIIVHPRLGVMQTGWRLSESTTSDERWEGTAGWGKPERIQHKQLFQIVTKGGGYDNPLQVFECYKHQVWLMWDKIRCNGINVWTGKKCVLYKDRGNRRWFPKGGVEVWLVYSKLFQIEKESKAMCCWDSSAKEKWIR